MSKEMLSIIRYPRSLVIVCIAVTLATISILTSCGSFSTTRIVASLDQTAMILPQSGAVAQTKNGIVAVAAPLNDVRQVNVFVLVLMNETEHWISFRDMDCFLLDHSGKTYTPLTEKQRKLYLPKGYKPELPQPLGTELFRWRRGRKVRSGQGVLPREDLNRIAVMPGRRAQVYLYFKLPYDRLSTLRLIVPHVRNEVTQEETTVVFKFEVVKG